MNISLYKLGYLYFKLALSMLFQDFNWIIQSFRVCNLLQTISSANRQIQLSIRLVIFKQNLSKLVRISLYSDKMRAAKQKQMLLLLFLFLCTLALSITALVLALLVGPLHNNPSSFIL